MNLKNLHPGNVIISGFVVELDGNDTCANEQIGIARRFERCIQEGSEGGVAVS